MVHGWVYGLHNGLINDMRMSVFARRLAGAYAQAPAELVVMPSVGKLESSSIGQNRSQQVEPCFPQQLTDPRVFEIARALQDGLTSTTRSFRRNQCPRATSVRAADWHGQQTGATCADRVYDLRVDETVERLESATTKPAPCPWRSGTRSSCFTSALLTGHHQPELAETFSTRSPSRSCTASTTRTTSSSCGQRVDRIHRRRRRWQGYLPPTTPPRKTFA